MLGLPSSHTDRALATTPALRRFKSGSIAKRDTKKLVVSRMRVSLDMAIACVCDGGRARDIVRCQKNDKVEDHRLLAQMVVVESHFSDSGGLVIPAVVRSGCTLTVK